MALSVALILALILLTAVTNVFSFVLGIILSIITVVLMNQVFGAETIPQAKVTVTQDDAKTVVNEDGEVDVAYVRSVQATQDMNNNNNGLGYDIIDIAVSQWVLKIQCGVYALAKTAFGKVSLAIGGCALALAIYGAAIHNSDLKTLAWCMGFVGLCIDFIEMAHALLIDIASIKSKAMETGALVMNFGAMAVSTYMADQG